MISPSIDLDLDMNLLHSPVPPTQGGSGDGGGGGRGGDIGQVKVPPAARNDLAINSLRANDHDSVPTLSARRGEYCHLSTLATASREHPGNTSDANESAERGTSSQTNEHAVSDNKPTQDRDSMTRMVESWREELYTMNVKNSILLDDLVKLGSSGELAKNDNAVFWR